MNPIDICGTRPKSGCLALKEDRDTDLLVRSIEFLRAIVASVEKTNLSTREKTTVDGDRIREPVEIFEPWCSKENPREPLAWGWDAGQNGRRKSPSNEFQIEIGLNVFDDHFELLPPLSASPEEKTTGERYGREREEGNQERSKMRGRIRFLFGGGGELGSWRRGWRGRRRRGWGGWGWQGIGMELDEIGSDVHGIDKNLGGFGCFWIMKRSLVWI